MAGLSRALRGLLYDAHPYSWLWLDAVPLTAMALWLRGPDVRIGRLALLILVLVMIDAGQNTFNDISDLDTDRASDEVRKRRRGVTSGAVSKRWAYVQAGVLTVGALVLAVRLSVAFGVLLVGGVAYGAAYSARGVGISGRPYVGQVFWLVLILAMYFASYLVLGGDLGRGIAFALGDAVYISGVESIVKDMRDLEADRVGGRRTTPLIVGLRRAGQGSFIAATLATAAWLASLLLAGHSAHIPAFAVVVVVVILIGWLMRLRTEASAIAEVYRQTRARKLHRDALLVFLAVNLCFIAALLLGGR